MKRKRWRTALVAALGLLLAVSGAATWLYVFPPEDEPRAADAIVVLGGLSSKPLTDAALDLAAAGYSDTIVISDAFGGDTRPANLCADDDSAYRIECFSPDPSTTQGEARAIADLAEDRGWDSVLVVTTTYHVVRARLLVGRCYPGRLAVIGTGVPMDIWDWMYQYSYQTAGFLKAWTSPGC